MTDKTSEEKRRDAEKLFEAEKSKLLQHIHNNESVEAVVRKVNNGKKA
jgi:hypothetical protein